MSSLSPKSVTGLRLICLLGGHLLFFDSLRLFWIANESLQGMFLQSSKSNEALVTLISAGLLVALARFEDGNEEASRFARFKRKARSFADWWSLTATPIFFGLILADIFYGTTRHALFVSLPLQFVVIGGLIYSGTKTKQAAPLAQQ